jgi:DNA-binding transcriptional regulator YdaS (Cro superfamily)
MTLSEYIAELDRGGQSRLARELGFSAAFMCRLQNGTRTVPPGRVLEIARATNWMVTPHEMRPDLYPNRLDAVPRGKTA